VSISHCGLSDATRGELEQIAKRYGLSLNDLKSRSRTAQRVAARAECFAHLQSKGFSLSQIGGAFNRDHTTVLWALGRTKRARERKYQAIHKQSHKRRTDALSTP
jgi:chromosomal replication initiation ATPase DnaA